MRSELWERRNGLVVLAVGAILVGVAVSGSAYWLYLFCLVAIYAIVGIGFNVALGVAGQVTFAQVGFMAIGAYTSALLEVKEHWNPWLAILAGVVFSAAVAALVYLPFLRLRGHYLAMGTLALALGVQSLATNARGLTGGALGVGDIPTMTIGGFAVDQTIDYFVLFWVAAGICLGVYHLLVSSHLGRAWRAVAARPDVPESVGVSVSRVRLLALVVASGMAGLAGALFGQFLSYVSPDYFDSVMIGNIFFVLIVGGSGQLAGPLIGAALVVLLPEQISFFGSWQNVAMLAVLLLWLILWPSGILGDGRELGSIRGLLPRRRRLPFAATRTRTQEAV
ncbi:branched-chain amino acid ABC transporter permease [Nocardia alni]|uniref:branched-chain amino acid ABC transporter permease n=1 Tax=Nocardia alni TaxID=2815723 RepID=UPI001C23DDCA|nr:branched-chain amino acid ABC transporter permease [Nocardia alni]